MPESIGVHITVQGIARKSPQERVGSEPSPSPRRRTTAEGAGS